MPARYGSHLVTLKYIVAAKFVGQKDNHNLQPHYEHSFRDSGFIYDVRYQSDIGFRLQQHVNESTA